MEKNQYTVNFVNSSAKEFRELPAVVKARISLAIDALELSPRPTGVKKLHNEKNLYRIRVGDFRIVYQIDDGEKTILVTRIRHRKEVYR
jgi:mRNA interferase RelE/StbE